MKEFIGSSTQTIDNQNYFEVKSLIILKIFLIIFLCYSYYKLKSQKIMLDINKYKEKRELNEGGELEIFKNPSKNIKIETKTGEIFKSDIIFLIIPGGAYKVVSHIEGFPIAERFFSLGYSAAILKYSIFPKCYPTNYEQGLKALQILSKKFPKIILIGFSAGGHLAALLGTTERKKIFNAVGMILCYPVISFVKKFHKDSRSNFFGNKTKNNKKNQKLFSIEYRVNNDTLPTFIWTLKNDKIVPYENTLFMIKKLKENKVKFDYKIYKKGFHGIALADDSMLKYGKRYKNNEIAKWVNLSCNFFEKII